MKSFKNKTGAKFSKQYPEWKFMIAFFSILLFLGMKGFSETPTVTVRFATPEFDCDTQNYCVDVEFQSDIPDQQLFGMNVRFFFDDDALEFIAFVDYENGYGPFSPNPPEVYTAGPDSGPELFNFIGAATYVNGAIQLVNTGADPIFISTTEWTRIYSICFNIKDPDAFGIDNFCPSIVWDLEEIPENGGFLTGSDGVVITVVDDSGDKPDPLAGTFDHFAGMEFDFDNLFQHNNPNPAANNVNRSTNSAPTIENVVQFNWEYSGNPDATPWGSPVEEVCIDTFCEAELTINKTAAEDEFNAVGDVLNYTIVVTNTGYATITDINVVDDLTGDSWFIDVLQPGESETFYTSYTITQDDLDAGFVLNTVIASGQDPDGIPVENDDSATVPPVFTAQLAVSKTADQQTYNAVGDIITYTIVVENTGNVTITDIDVVDDLTGDAWFIASLGPDSIQTFTATYTITQDDLDSGSVLNTVTVTGEYPDGTIIDDTDTALVVIQDEYCLVVMITAKTNVSCFDGNDGSATATALCGVEPYTYQWNDPQSQTTPTASGLAAGTYTVTVTDANGMQATAMAEISQPTEIVAEITQVTNTSCDNSETGSATIMAMGGTPPYSFLWDTTPEQTSATATNLGMGTYEVTVTDANGCVVVAEVSIESEGSLEILAIDDIGPLCPGAEVYPILLSATPANYDVVYHWSGGEEVGLENGSATGVNPRIPAFTASNDFGSSTITVVASLDGCISTTTFTVEIADDEPPVFENCPEGQVITVSLFPGDCEGGVNWSIPYATDNCGEVTVTQTEGPPPGSILPVGTYPIEYTATDAAGNSTTCSFTLEVIDTEGPVIVCPGNFVITNTDPGECQWTSPPGSLSPLLATGNCDFEVIWEAQNPDGSIASGYDDISGYVFDPGTTTITYTITENDSQQSWSCSFTVTVLDTQAPSLTCPPAIVQDADEGACSASLTPNLTADNVQDNCTDYDELDISFRVFNPDNSISDYMPNATTYVFDVGISQIEWTVTDQAGNTASCFQQIVIEAIMPVADAGADDVICAGESYQLSGSASDYESVLWTTSGTGSFVPDANSLDAVYVPGNADIIIGQVQLTLTAFGFGDCPDTQDMMMLQIHPQPSAHAGPDAEICENTTFMVTGASAENYTQISWTHNGFGELLNAGTLFPTYISHPDDVIAGMVTLTLSAESSGACAPAVDQMAIFIKPEVYADAGEDQVLVDEFTTTLNANDPYPGSGSWSQISGPNVPLIAEPDNPQSTVSGLTYGTYTFRWTIENDPCPGDFDDMTITVEAAEQPELSITKTVQPEGYVSPGTMLQYTIAVENTGNIDLSNITITDVLPDYTSFLSASDGGVYDQVSNMVTWGVDMLATGESLTRSLYVEVDDDVPHEWVIPNTATAESDQTPPAESDPAEVIAIRQVALQIVSVTHVLCHGQHTGSATVEATGGLPPYAFTWYTQPVQTGDTAYDLPAGTYVVVVTDALGNTAQLSVTITQPEAPLDAIASVTNVSCNGAATGSIHVEVYDGTPPYTFMWSNGATTQHLEDVVAGIYTLEITDDNGCVFTIQEEIKEPPALFVMDIMVEDVFCKEDSLGSIYYSITGGVPPYEYLWNNGHTTRTLNNMPGGIYEVTITDANNCVHTHEFEIGYQYEDCEIRVPEGISMNQSGFNDIWIINGLQRYPNNKVQVFNRWGTLVYEASPYQNDWDGTPNKGRILTESDGKLPAGTYYWIIRLDPNLEPLSGFIYLGR